jgi:diadenosine tetraphosphatase ApaH/serine/threonine PP2A family protein phosphatase
MARYAIIADIHGNLEAFTAVAEFLKGRAIDRYVVCGDIVGYNANPNECIALAQGLRAVCVLGNHDSLSVYLDPSFESHADADRALEWTREQLSVKSLDFLGALKPGSMLDGMCVVHATPIDPQEFYYVRDDPEPQGPDDEHSCYVEDIFKFMRAKSMRLCFYGHSHVPLIRAEYEGDGYTFVTKAGPVLSMRAVHCGLPFAAALVNVGSVGQPRDGDPRACVTIYDNEQKFIQQHRVPYDVRTAQQKIVAAGLPASLARRLAGDEAAL